LSVRQLIKKRAECSPDEKVVQHGGMITIVKKTPTEKLIEKLFRRGMYDLYVV